MNTSFYINWAFYTARPFLPRKMQIFLRRQIVRYKSWKGIEGWPIDATAQNEPKGWQGWKDGMKFALVLSHDVDTQKGLKDCLKLVDLEENLGFRSTFNFVPERYGKIPGEILSELKRRGFGVGVHGLKHDGKLFASRKIFDQRVVKINHYLKEWNTKGFSAPSMLRNFEWMGAMDIDYATTTFDTDPFEPQPDGAGSIFPFWVWNNEYNRAYLEMPYTLPQDFTLFVLMRKTDTQIWDQKLDWIASNGGMALLNSHSDYMDFGGQATSDSCYPVEFFTGFLRKLWEKYQGCLWNPLASELSEFFRERYAFDSRNSDENIRSAADGRP